MSWPLVVQFDLLPHACPEQIAGHTVWALDYYSIQLAIVNDGFEVVLCWSLSETGIIMIN